MMVCRGDVWLVNLNPVKKNNEVGKIRPVVVMQNDELNEGSYPTTVILPMTTSLIDDAEPLRLRVSARDALEQDSDILIAHIRSIDNARFIKKLTSLTKEEMQILKEFLFEVLS